MGVSLHVCLSQTVLFDQNTFLDHKNTTDPDIGRSDRGVNYQSTRGVPLSATDGDLIGSDGRAPQGSVPTPGQFKGVITYGAVSLPHNKYYSASGDLLGEATEIPLSGGNFESNASKLAWPHSTSDDGSTDLVLRTQMGAPYICLLYTSPSPRDRG